MKKYLLFIGLFCFISSYGQERKKSKDGFTYKKISIIDSKKGTLSISGSNNTAAPSSKSYAAKSSNVGIGTTDGELSVSLTGGATYKVPIDVPSGINGVAPEISLIYNSQSSNGLAGYGWNVSGVSVISRIASTKYHDGVIDPVDFDNLDRFALDGQRLVLKSGTYGANGAQYQTEKYSNLKIVSYGVSSYGTNGPEYFAIYYPDGSIAYYGKNSDSKTDIDYAISYWQNAQGLRIDYEYERGTKLIRISKIKYGSNSTNEIQFNYSLRKRFEQVLINRKVIEQTRILKSIKVLGGGIAYRNYYLDHDHTNLEYERLTRIQEKSGDNSLTHRPIYFHYSNSPSSIEFTDVTTDIGVENIEQRNSETVSLDLSGNGKMDFIVYPKNQKNKFWVFKDFQNGGSNLAIQVNSGSFESLFPVTMLTSSNKVSSSQGIALIQNTSNNNVKIKVYGKTAPSTGLPIGYQYEKIWNAPTASNQYTCGGIKQQNRIPQSYLSGDFNGDGLSDVLAISKPYSYNSCKRKVPCDGDGDPIFNPNTTLDSIIQAHDGITRPPPSGGNNCCDCTAIPVTSSNLNFINLDRRITSNFVKSVGRLQLDLKTTDRLLTADVNGDGKTDILHFTKNSVYVYNLNQNENLQLLFYSNIRIDPNSPILLGDYNGDGKTDFLTPDTSSSAQNYYNIHFNLHLSLGNDFTRSSGQSIYPFAYAATNFNTSSNTLYGYNLIPLDINGDGKTDIIDYRTETYIGNSNGTQTLRVYENLGIESGDAKFTSARTITKNGNLKHFPIPIFLTSDTPNKNLEFASISNKWVTSFSFKKDHREDMLLRSVNNNAINYDINYNSIDSSENTDYNITVYQPKQNETFPNIDIKVAPNFKVVSSLERSTPNEYTIRKQIYSYYGAVYNLEGLGFQGFQGIAKSNWHTDGSNQIFNVSKFSTQLRGTIYETYVQPHGFSFTNTPSNYISKSSYTHASSLASNKVFKVWKNSSISQNSIEGTIINKTFLYDTYNNPTKIITNYSSHGSRVIDLSYDNNIGSNYYIGRLHSEKETITIDGNTFSTEKQFIYTGHLLSQKKMKSNGTPFDIETYNYDEYGNLTKKITTPYNTASRIVRFEYDPSGRFIKKSYDIEGLATTYEYNSDSGTLKKEINPFGQATIYEYDGFNMPTKETDYNGKNITTSYARTGIYGDGLKVTVIADDGSSSISFYDSSGRISLRKEKDVLGQWVKKDYKYDKLGRSWKESDPYIGSGALLWNITEYDFYSRPIRLTSSTGKTTNISYNLLSVTVDDGTKIVTTTKNTMNKITRVTDSGGTINYTYFGNGTIKTVDYDGVVISNEQDGWGRKVRTTDPSAGTYTYIYNGFDEITKETTPKGSTDFTYSSTGKLMQKKVVGDLTNMTLQYSYHPTNKMISSLSVVSSDGNNSNYTYNYDNTHRLIRTIESNTYAQFTKNYTYDAFNRIATEESKARLMINNKTSVKKIKNTYQNGIIKTISDNATNEILWNVDALNARGQTTAITMGNNLRIRHSYNSNGYLTVSTSEKDINTSPTQLMQLTFDFDTQKGTLKNRTNSLFSWTEHFTYDNMDRLLSFNDTNGNKSHTYDTQGRITKNSLVGNYSYSGKSYQLSSLDANYSGWQYFKNIVKQDVSYNAFKSPVEIKVAGKDKISFQYNGFMGRANMFYGDTQDDKLLRKNRKHYSSDGSMEISYERNTGTTTFVTYIGGDAYNAQAIWRSKQGAITTNGYYYLHRDYLGSILMISDTNGIVKEKRHFDAWGNIVKLTDGNNLALNNFVYLDRGYTGHEHLLGVGLVHMNGRLYDPMLHRFLAPDNYVQNPYNTQNFNRFGYVLNNPLMYNDPSGESGEGFFNVPVLGWLAYGLFSLGKAIFGSNDATTTQNSVVTGNYDLGTSSNAASSSAVPPIPGSGYRLENPNGIWQNYKNGVLDGYSNFWSNFGKELTDAVNNPWAKWKQNMGERGGWKNFIPGYSAYQMTVGTTVHNYQVASTGISHLINGNYYEAGYVYGHFQAEGHFQLGLAAVTAGVIKGVSVSRIRATTWNGFQKATAGQFSSRAEAATAWRAYKSANGIVTGTTRSIAQRSAFLKMAAASGKYPKWMNQWLRKGKVPPGYNVDHFNALFDGGLDIPSNMRLKDVGIHTTRHRYYRPK